MKTRCKKVLTKIVAGLRLAQCTLTASLVLTHVGKFLKQELKT